MPIEIAELAQRIKANSFVIKQAATKQAFVPAPGGQTEPVVGSSPMTAALSAPMGGQAPAGAPPADPAAAGDPAAMGAPPDDPAAMGAVPSDPSAMGAPPADPSAMGDPAAGGDPMAGMPPDVAAALTGALGAPGAAPAPGQGTITMSVPELISLIQVLKGGDKPSGQDTATPAKSKSGSTSAQLAEIKQLLTGGAAPAATPAAAPAA